MEHKAIGLELKAVNNLIKRRVIKERPPELDEFTAVHGWAMRFFYENQGKDLFQRDFEEYFQIRRSTATKILQSMEKHALIRREPVAYDARLKKIILTDKAVRLYTIILQDIEKLEQQMAAGLTQDELTVFFSILDKIKDNLGGL